MAKISIKNIDEFEANFDLFLSHQIDNKNQYIIDKYHLEFMDLFCKDFEFCKKHYPKQTNFYINKLKEKSSFENIKTLKYHIENVNEYIDNANQTPSTKNKTLKKLSDEYYRMLNPKDFFKDTKIIEYLESNKESIKECFNLVNSQYQTPNQTEPPQTKIEPIDSTLHQQFLIFHYLLKHLEVSSNSIDKTQIARFIQFATQKQLEAKKIQNTSIYKLVDNPFNGYKKEQGTTQTNLQKVRELFESIGLKTIAEIVSKDIV